MRVNVRGETDVDLTARSSDAGPAPWRAVGGPAFPGDAVRPRSKVRSLITGTAKLAVSAGLIIYLLSRYSPDVAMLRRIDAVWCLVAFAALFATLPVASERWRRIVVHLGGAAPWRSVFSVFATSAFFSQVLPSVGGDLVRVVYYRLLGSTPGAVLVSIVIDRGMGIMGLLLLALGAYPLLSAWIRTDVISVPIEVIAVSALSGAGIAAVILPFAKRSAIWRRVPSTLGALLDAIAWAVASRDGLLRLLPLSALVHILSIIAVYAIAQSLGIHLGLRAAAGATPIILLAQVLPISIGGWGVRETAAVTVLSTLGIDPSAALTLSVIFGTLFALATLPGLVCWFNLRR